MVKRLLSLGAAVTLALSLSISSFAAIYHSTVNLEFPFYGHIRVRQGGTELFIGTDGVPVSGDSASSLSGSGGSIIFDFYPRSGAYTTDDDATIQFHTQYSYYDIDLAQHDKLDVYYKANGDIDYIDSPITNFDGTVYTTVYTEDIGSDCTVYCKNINGGSYLLEGFLEFPYGSINDEETWLNMISGVSGQVITSTGSYALSIPFTSYDIKTTNNKDRVNFKLALGVPYTGEYSRVFFQFNSRSTSGIPGLSAFSVNTGSLQFQEIEGINGLGIALANWFNETINAIKNGFYTQSLDAGAAAENKDQETVDDTQSKVEQVSQYEATVHQNISSGISELQSPSRNYLDIQTATSTYTQALAAVGFIFSSVFGTLNGFQVVITIPLVLGLVLLLLGRGSFALGRYMDIGVRRQHRLEYLNRRK